MVAWSPDNNYVAFSGMGSWVKVWDVRNNNVCMEYDVHARLFAQVFTLAWSPDGKEIVSACSASGIVDKTVHRWEARSGRLLQKYKTPFNLFPDFNVFSLSWSPDREYIAAGTQGKVWVWHVTSGHSTEYGRSSSNFVSVAWSPDSTRIAAACDDRKVHIWQRATGQEVVSNPGHMDRLRDVSWSPDGNSIASASVDKTVQIWNGRTGQHIFTYTGHSDATTAVTWSPDGTQIASASNDRTVQVWQAL